MAYGVVRRNVTEWLVGDAGTFSWCELQWVLLVPCLTVAPGTVSCKEDPKLSPLSPPKGWLLFLPFLLKLLISCRVPFHCAFTGEYVRENTF